MKKLLALFSLIFCVFVANAQDPQLNETVNQTLDYGTDRSYIYYNGNTTDTIGISDSIWTYTFRIKSKFKLQPTLRYDIDTVTGISSGDSALIGLYSKTFSDENYILRESKVWYGSADTNYTLESDSAHISEFWQFKIIGYTDEFKAEVQKLILKVVEDR